MDLDPVRGSEQGKKRPCLVLQNDVGNATSTTTIVACITSQLPSRHYPFHVWLPDNLLEKQSVVPVNNCAPWLRSGLTRRFWPPARRR